ncbi:lipopolysaccharide biosynthesis protein [Photobacterium leiognathi]|uniref:lipopolysaccharide biosynthesis protein n=1 Tax=Photobacterium leiognathi TaxID=553611 RepID=UPI002980DA8B|nr:hypothetical protein [Photobacterium leiognathi]
MNKNTILIIGARLIQILITLVSLRVMTSMLMEKDLGLYYILNSLYMLVSLFIINPFGQYFNRNTNNWNEKGVLYSKFLSFLKFTCFISAVYGMILYVLSLFSILHYSALVCFILGIYLFSLCLNQFLMHTLNLLEEKKIFAIMISGTALLSLIISYLLLTFKFSNLNEALLWILGVSVSNILFLIYGVISLKNKLTIKGNNESFLNKEENRKILSFVYPIAISTFFMWFLNSGYRFFIENQMGLFYLGGFGVAFGVAAQIMAVFESLSTQILQPRLFKEIDSNNKIDREKHLNIYILDTILIYFSVSVFVTCYIKYIFLTLIDNKFLTFSYIGMAAIWFEFFRAATNSIGMIAFSEKKTKLLIYPYVISAMILLVLLLVLSLFSNHYDFNRELLLPLSVVISAVISFFAMISVTLKNHRFKLNYAYIAKRVFVLFPIVFLANFFPDFSEFNYYIIFYLMLAAFLYVLILYVSIKFNRDK